MALSRKFPVRPVLVAAAILILLAGGASWLATTFVADCLLTERERATSPDGALDLVVFSRDCGATTGANTQASIIGQGDELRPAVESFVAMDGTLALNPTWTGPNAVTLTIPTATNVIRQQDAVGATSITYN